MNSRELAKVPSRMMEGIIMFHRFILNTLNMKGMCPEARASAMYYFQRTYHGDTESEEHIVYQALTCLHLGLKIQMHPVVIQKLVSVLDIVRKNSDCCQAFSQLRSLHESFDILYPKAIAEISRLEMNIIYELNFELETPLPYQYHDMFIQRILSWHLPRSNLLFRQAAKVLVHDSEIFLNDMQQLTLFYTNPVNVVALLAARLAFDRYGIRILSPTNLNVFHFLLPSTPANEFEAKYDSIKAFFIQKGVAFNLSFEPRDIYKAMTKWYATPIYDPPGFGVGNTLPPPPPPYELLKKIAGPEDAFSHLYSTHQPDMPPPDYDVQHIPQKAPISKVTISKEPTSRIKEQPSRNFQIDDHRSQKIDDYRRYRSSPLDDRRYRGREYDDYRRHPYDDLQPYRKFDRFHNDDNRRPPPRDSFNSQPPNMKATLRAPEYRNDGKQPVNEDRQNNKKKKVKTPQPPADSQSSKFTISYE